jgi:tellurite methyltransferase
VNDLQKKWNSFYSCSNQASLACEVLTKHAFLMPKTGKGLDLACGLGGNALLMASAGLDVEAWDISGVALQNISVRPCQIIPEILPIEQYEIIVVSRFLDRSLSNAIMAALKPKGLLFYQTYCQDKIDSLGPNNPEYLLAKNELLSLFSALSLIFYQEYAKVGDLEYGNRNEALFIGQKS